MTGREFGTNTAAWTAWWNNVQHDGSFHLPFEEAALQTNAPIESVEEEEPEETVEGPVAWPSLHLAGVLRGTARRKGAAVINNQIVREEDRVEGVLLAAVREDSVTLKYHGQTRVLRVNESIRE